MLVGWSRSEMAAMVVRSFSRGWVVNLGTGMPTQVLAATGPDLDVCFHSENGIIGMTPLASGMSEDPDLISAGKTPVGLRPGGSIVDHADSFALVRRGYLDAAVMGAYEVSSEGHLANWKLDGEAMGSVGGAMDIAVHAQRLFIMMSHNAPDGTPKLVGELRQPVTAYRVVNRVFTNLAVIDIAPGGFVVSDLAPGVTWAYLSERTNADLAPGSEGVRQWAPNGAIDFEMDTAHEQNTM